MTAHLPTCEAFGESDVLIDKWENTSLIINKREKENFISINYITSIFSYLNYLLKNFILFYFTN